MPLQANTPISTTVVAFDVSGAGAAEAGVVKRFDDVVVVARELGYVTQDAGSPNLTLTFAPETEIGSALHRVAGAITEFDGSSAPLRVRAVVHYGVVFRTVLKGQISYLGSAIRSTQSALRRAPEKGSVMATREFFAYASTLTGLPFSLKSINGTAAADGMSQVVFADIAAVRLPAENGLPSADPAFVEFVKRRLAADIGPFASALVDRAMRSAAMATQLVTVLSPNIDDATARASFERDVFGYVKSRGKN
ncbi:MAG: hypothetical protein M0P95_07820 [Sulfuritalea sp.]|nr:hypothetical protein [Sulfuritalea sp.]